MRDKKFCDDLIIEGKSPPKKLIRSLVLLFIAALIALFFFGVKPKLAALRPEAESSSDSYVNTFSDSDQDDDIPEFENRDTSLLYAYNHMSANNQKLYAVVCGMMEAGEFTLDRGLSGYTAEDIKTVTYGIYADHPEWCWYTGSYWLRSDSASNEILELSFTAEHGLLCSESEVKKIQSEAENAAKSIIDEANQQPSDYDKALFVHDTLVRNIEYNDELAKKRLNNKETNADSLNCSMYGALVNGSAVCQGYAQAYQYIMNQLGIECAYVSGTADGGSHAWNLIKLDGEYYFTDVTWDDPTEKGEDKHPLGVDFVTHRYFCLTTEEMGADHAADDSFELPECTSTACSYYVHSGTYFQTYDYSEVEGLIRNAITNKSVIELKFAPNIFNQAKGELIDSNGVGYIMRDAEAEGSYSHRESSPVILLGFNKL